MSQFEPRPFGKYFLTDRIAVGGMAEIYKAKTFGVDGFEKTLAIKKILANYSADKDFTTMLTDEAKLVVSLSHPNIVQIYDLGRVGDDYFISMEFIDGVNLRELINRGMELGESIPPDVCLYVASEICKGLDYAHAKRGMDGKSLGIVHRDVSPHNILVSFEGEVKIVDFGIAKAAQNVSQTDMGTLKGKVTYMSPEQAVGRSIDHRTDIFSCGIVLYEMLTFERLFTGDSQLEVLNFIRNTRITEDKLKGKALEPAVKVLARALSYNSKDRYQSAADMQVDLSRLLYSRFHDFTPRKLSELLRRWYGQAAGKGSEAEALPAYDTDSLLITSQEQINIVHRESMDDEMMPVTLSPGEVSSSVFSRSGSGLRVEEPTERQLIITERRDHLKKWLLRIGLGLAIAICGYFVFNLVRHAKPVTENGEDTVASVKLVSRPDGAKIYIDGRDTGLTTPAVLKKMRLGQRYELILTREGYEPLSTSVILDSPKPRPLNLTLIRIVPVGYSLTVRSEPLGARVTLDGKDTGKVTPAEFMDFVIGQEYKIALALAGYQPYASLIRNDSSKDQIVDVNLLKIPDTVIKIHTVPDGAKIFMNGQDLAEVTPYEVRNLTVPQVIEFKFHKDGYEDVLETIGLTEPGEKSIHIKMSPMAARQVIDDLILPAVN